MSEPMPGHVDEIAAELALGVVDGEERARALEHLAGCIDCRRTVDELSEVADGLLLLAPSREVPIGFESRALAPLGGRRRRSRRRSLLPIAAAAAAAALAVAGTLLVVNDDLDLASDYRGILAEANGKEFDVARLYGGGEEPVGTVFGYHGTTSWLFVIVYADEREGVRGAELVRDGGGDVQLTSFALDPANGSWGGVLPVALDEVSMVRVLRAGGEPLVARLAD